jgi:hypothetical protein
VAWQEGSVSRLIEVGDWFVRKYGTDACAVRQEYEGRTGAAGPLQVVCTPVHTCMTLEGWNEFVRRLAIFQLASPQVVNFGSCRMGSRERSLRSTPPTGSICLRIDSAKFRAVAGSDVSAAARISQASSSRDRLADCANTEPRRNGIIELSDCDAGDSQS